MDGWLLNNPGFLKFDHCAISIRDVLYDKQF